MKIRTRRLLALTLGGLIGLSSTARAQAPSENSARGIAMWTIAGAGGGFGVGLWAGLTKFDDAINSDRKVWTSAVVGAAVGAMGGYLIGRSRAGRPRPNPSSTARPQLDWFRTLRSNRRERLPLDSGLPRSFSFHRNVRENGLTFGRQADTLFSAPLPTTLGTTSQ
jgi:hypothetical protein